MAKNTWQIANAKLLAQHKKDLDRLTEEYEENLKRDIEGLYGALAVYLHRKGFEPEECRQAITDIGRLWEDVSNDPTTTMVALCYKETGWDFRDIDYATEEELAEYGED